MDILLSLMAFAGWLFVPRTTMVIYVVVMVLKHKEILPLA